MAFCPHCGKEVDGAAVVCPSCGVQIRELSTASANDRSSFGFALLGFFFPLVGLILFLVWKDDYPKRSKSAGKGALAGFITGIVLFILYIVLIFAIVSASMNATNYL